MTRSFTIIARSKGRRKKRPAVSAGAASLSSERAFFRAKEWEQEQTSYENPEVPKIEEHEDYQTTDGPVVDDLDVPF